MDKAIFEQIRGYFLRWIEAVAEWIARIQDSLSSARTVRLVEQPDHVFVAQGAEGETETDRYVMRDGVILREGVISRDGDLRDGALVDDGPGERISAGGGRVQALRGARVSLELLPDRFVFRDLDLPANAGAFIEGVVRAQIDRITPWSASQAAFGMRHAPDVDGERIHVTVAATARNLMTGFVTAASAAGAQSVVVTTRPAGDEGGAPIAVLHHMAQQSRATEILRGRLLKGLAAAGVFAGASALVAVLGGGYLTSWRDGVEDQIAAARRTLQSGPGNGGSRIALHREKAQASLSTLVLEALSRALPDDVYLSGLEIRGDTLRITGVTPDASKVVGLIERTPTFSRATFAAPTVRSTTEPGERFQIEAHIAPVYPAFR